MISNPSNRGHRLERAATIVRYEVGAALGRPTLVAFAGNSTVAAAKGGNSSSRAVFARLPDWPEMVVWQHWLRPGDTFVDVGANVGLYSLVAAETGADVLAVEPAADMAALLRTNADLSGANRIVVCPLAVMDRSGRVALAGPDANQRRALVVGDDEDSVPASTLDALTAGRRVQGIKIDVEGNERLVLEGATTLLADPSLQVIQLEWNATSLAALGEDRAPVTALLRGAGFELYRADHGGQMVRLDGVPGYGRDVIAARGTARELLTGSPWR